MHLWPGGHGKLALYCDAKVGGGRCGDGLAVGCLQILDEGGGGISCLV